MLEAVARISAFPLQTLRLEQTLVNELGFDSLMLVELDQSVGKAFPSLGGLPRELFSKTTTSATVIEHIVTTLESGVTAKADAPAVVHPGRALRAHRGGRAAGLALGDGDAFERPLLVTKDSLGVAEAVVSQLKAHGITAVVGDVSTEGHFAGVINLADPRREAATTARRPARCWRSRRRSAPRRPSSSSPSPAWAGSSASTAPPARRWARSARSASPRRWRRSGPTRW